MRVPALALALATALPALAEDEGEAVGVGSLAPNFALKTLNADVVGESWIALDRYVGDDAEDGGARIVVLSFFASWCAPCQKEMPLLERLHRAYRAHGLRVLSVSIDGDEEGMAAARRMVTRNRVTYPVLSDRFNVLARRYLGEQAPLPSLFVVGRDGVIRRIERGYTRDAAGFLVADVQTGLGLRSTPALAAPARKGAPTSPASAPAARPVSTRPR